MGIPIDHPAIVAARAKGLITGEGAPVAAKVKPRPATVAASASLRLVVVVPVQLVPVANRREHWAAKHRRVAAEIQAMKFAGASGIACAALQGLAHHLARDPALGVVVTLTRLGGRKWDDDNNVSGLKAVRDGVANWWLGQDDGSDRIRFCYEQEPGGAVGVRVTIEAA